MILESIVTTTNADGTTNIAPMGPIVGDEKFSTFLLRPFQTSTTFTNLKRNQCGVIHVVDDVNLIVDGALDTFEQTPELTRASAIHADRLIDCCRYFEFVTESIDEQSQRSEINCRTVKSDEVRPFWGFNRARHAILELTILATRINLLDSVQIKLQAGFLLSAIEKTGGPLETKASNKLLKYFNSHGIDLME